MMARHLKATLRWLLSGAKSQFQLLVIAMSVLVVVWVLVLLQRPLDAMSKISKDAPQTPRPEYTNSHPVETDLDTIYTKGFSGYNTSRIPALVYHKGYFLAFCEARKETSKDIGNMDIVVRRGRRKGWNVDWGKVIIVTSQPGYRVMNPTPIVDKDLEAIVLVFIVIKAHLNQWVMVQNGFIQQRVMVTRSFDNGLTWTHPRDITASTLGKMSIAPGIYAPGPGHGIQLKSGKLVVPGNYFVRDKNGIALQDHEKHNGSIGYASVMVSADHGLSWKMAGHVPFDFDTSRRPIHTSEPMVVEVGNSLILNTRTLHPDLPRVQSVSTNEGFSFSKGRLIPELIEPGYKTVDNQTFPSKAAGCQASVLGFPAPSRGLGSGTWAVFSNPASSFRERMSVRLSQDGLRTYSEPWTVYSQPAAYSDLTYFETKDRSSGLKLQNFALLFEGGVDDPYEKIMFKMFNLETLLAALEKHPRRPKVSSEEDRGINI